MSYFAADSARGTLPVGNRKFDQQCSLLLTFSLVAEDGFGCTPVLSCTLPHWHACCATAVQEAVKISDHRMAAAGLQDKQVPLRPQSDAVTFFTGHVTH